MEVHTHTSRKNARLTGRAGTHYFREFLRKLLKPIKKDKLIIE